MTEGVVLLVVEVVEWWISLDNQKDRAFFAVTMGDGAVVPLVLLLGCCDEDCNCNDSLVEVGVS